jgi:hypothetical protein
MKLLYTALFLFSVSSCATRLHYIGNSFPASQSVDLYVDPSAIAKPYIIVGKGYIKEGIGSPNYIKRIQPLAINKAKQKGADAVLIQDYYAPATADLHTVLRTDSVGRGTVTVGNTTVQPAGIQNFTVLFLKYKQ